MTNTTLHLELLCNGKRLGLGPGEALDITKVSGLESSDIEVSLTDLATVDGSSLDGRHVKARPIHIEGSYRSLSGTDEQRETLVRFFNPKVSGILTATINGRARFVFYELEGWSLKSQQSMDGRVGFLADLICPDPYFLGPEKTPDNFDAVENTGDVAAGWYIELTGAFSNPKVTLEDTGEFMRVLTDIKEGDTLAISTEDREQTITLNGESSFRLIDRKSSPFKLQVGHNVIHITADSGEPVGDLRFRERFFGI